MHMHDNLMCSVSCHVFRKSRRESDLDDIIIVEIMGNVEKSAFRLCRFTEFDRASVGG